MRAAARRVVEVADRDDANVSGDLRVTAQLDPSQLPRIGEPRAHREVVIDQIVREGLGRRELRLRDAIALDVDGQRILAEARGDRRRRRAVEQGARQEVLSRVLRHVLAAALPVELAADRRAGRESRIGREDVDDRATLELLGVEHVDAAERAAVAELAARLRIERGRVEHDRRLAVVRGHRVHHGLEPAQRGVVVIEAAGRRHRRMSITDGS